MVFNVHTSSQQTTWLDDYSIEDDDVITSASTSENSPSLPGDQISYGEQTLCKTEGGTIAEIVFCGGAIPRALK